ncbi:MAG: SpoIIE family protein phosphatase [Gemmatimonadota bacterium]|nr:SpoIIE family protein phosphatase [Gemmatimonadota bacterium]
MTGCRLRLWRAGRGRLRPVLGTEHVDPPRVRIDEAGLVQPADDGRWLINIPELNSYWYEIVETDGDREDLAETLTPLLTRLLASEGETLALAKQLASRYEEIELLYTISEILGHTTRLEEAAPIILREVSDVVGARRASLFVHDESAGLLRPVAAIAKPIEQLEPIPVADADSITARAFRTRIAVANDPQKSEGQRNRREDRGYRGAAYLSVPIIYRASDEETHPVGVLNLTDRVGKDAFSGGERRLVSAVANQVGAALEHTRLVERDLIRQRVTRELELAHGLQMKLLVSPAVLGPNVDVAARCLPAKSVGGDFYHFVRLSEGRIGAMLGDVSSHGFAAALIMASVLSAAGIHAAEVASPDGTLRRLLESIEQDLVETEMHLALFYGVLDPARGVLRYTNAGHPHAFRISPDGTAERLSATSPPLGLTSPDTLVASETTWRKGQDLLLLFSDGIIDARNDDGEALGEDRVLTTVRDHLEDATDTIVTAVLDAASAFEATARDDRTIVALRV